MTGVPETDAATDMASSSCKLFADLSGCHSLAAVHSGVEGGEFLSKSRSRLADWPDKHIRIVHGDLRGLPHLEARRSRHCRWDSHGQTVAPSMNG